MRHLFLGPQQKHVLGCLPLTPRAFPSRSEDDAIEQDGHQLGPKNLHAYLCRVMYNRRSKQDPLWNSLVVGGFRDGER